LTEYVKNNKLVILIVVSALILGVITGATYSDTLGGETLSEIYNSVNESVSKTSLYSSFLKSLSIQFCRLLVLFLCGLTVVGSPICVFYIGYLGYTLGFSASFLLRNYGACGILGIIGGIFPHYFLLLPTYLYIGTVGINFSNRLLLGEKHLRDSFKVYTGKMLISAIFILVSCIVEGFISSLILKAIFKMIK